MNSARDRSNIGNVLIIAFDTVDGTINVCMHVCMSDDFVCLLVFLTCRMAMCKNWYKIGILTIIITKKGKAKEQTIAEINVRRFAHNYGVNFHLRCTFYDHI